MPRIQQFFRPADAEYVDEAQVGTDLAELAQPLVEVGMICQRRNRACREPGAVNLQPAAIEMPPRREWILTDRTTEQDDRRCRGGLGAVGKQRCGEAETIERPEQAA